MVKLSPGISVERVALPVRRSDGMYEVYYQLTKDSCVPGWIDTEESLGRWFKSVLMQDPIDRYKDYRYPYALQSGGVWTVAGRVIGDWRKVKFYQEAVD